jgi:DNA-binding transcriptional MocR family regulator
MGAAPVWTVFLVRELVPNFSFCEVFIPCGACRFKLLIPGADDSASVVRTQAFERGVLALPGTVFLPNGRATAYVRAAFSLLSPEEVDEALKRLRDTILDARAAAV